MNNIRRKMEMQTGDITVISHFEEIISLNIQRGKTKSILGLLPKAASMHYVYIIYFVCIQGFIFTFKIFDRRLNKENEY